jgi:hypothetical protein
MKVFSICLLAGGVGIGLSGCSSAGKVREQEAYLRGQREAVIAQQQAQEPVVWFRGPVHNPRVPWTEELTLTKALVAADYADSISPTSIKIIRQGQVYRVDIKRLLRGLEDPPLERGDVIEIGR